MRTFLILLTLPLFFTITGCEECLDNYPHNETPMSAGDVKKSGPDDYGGHNSQNAIVLPNGDTATKSATTQVK